MATKSTNGKPLSDSRLHTLARLGAKIELEHILKTFPGLLAEVQRDRKIAQAAYARSVKQAKQTEAHG